MRIIFIFIPYVLSYLPTKRKEVDLCHGLCGEKRKACGPQVARKTIYTEDINNVSD
jgi:hypothetical protein